MGLDPKILRQLIQTFKAELAERLQVITDALLALEKNQLQGDDQEKMITSVFRAAHNIKGSSRGLGIHNVSEIAHHLESLFALLQKKSLTISPEMINLGLEAVDKIGLAMEAFLEQQALPFELSDLITRLEGRNEDESAKKKAQETMLPSSLNQIHFSEKSDTSVRVEIDHIDRISALLEEIQVNKIAINDNYLDITKITHKTNQFLETWNQMLAFLRSKMAPNAGEHLEKLSHLGSDSLKEIANSIFYLQKNMRPRVNELASLSNSLQDEIRTLRLVPVNYLVCTLPRYVRDLAQQMNKKVDLTITGEDVKMDKAVLENLKDPLIHLLRNSVDHGIENPVERKEKHKNEVGQIKINITEENNQILINISDDGTGIDSNSVANIALNKKIVTKADLERMNEKEITSLIFQSGFSTKEIITSVSGRGIGLDVVKSALEKLNGHLDFYTHLGKGTTFELRVPLTLSSERGLMVKCCGQLFAIPTPLIQRVLLIHANHIVDVASSQAIMIEGHPIQLYTLVEILGLEQTEFPNEDQLSVFILKHHDRSLGILVDEIIGEREMVIKPLEPPLSHVPCVSGGTLLGSNQVVIVIHPQELFEKALNLVKTKQIHTKEFSSDTTTLKPHILVVDDSITTRTLEKNILETKNYQVSTAVNGKEAWDMLQKQSFALVITDVMMPIMDGFTLTEKVKTTDKLRHLPVIIVTSLGSEAEKKRGIDVGADAYIVKNEFQSGELLEIVEQLV